MRSGGLDSSISLGEFVMCFYCTLETDKMNSLAIDQCLIIE